MVENVFDRISRGVLIAYSFTSKETRVFIFAFAVKGRKKFQDIEG